MGVEKQPETSVKEINLGNKNFQLKWVTAVSKVVNMMTVIFNFP